MKSNQLVESKSRKKLTSVESCLVLLVLSKIKKGDKSFKVYEINVTEFGEITGYKKTPDLYERLRVAGKSLTRNPIEIELEKGYFYTNWLAGAVYEEGVLEITIDPRLEPYLLELKERFTILELKQLLKLRDPNTVRIYELLKQYERIGERTIALDDLKQYLGLGDKYSEYYNFKKRILTPSLEKINNKTDLNVMYKQLKRNKRVTKLVFSIKKKFVGTEETIKLEEPIEEKLVGLEKIDLLTM